MMYSVGLANSQCLFDSGDFKTAEEAVQFAVGRGGRYKVHICTENSNISAIYYGDKNIFAVDQYGLGNFTYFSQKQFTEYVR